MLDDVLVNRLDQRIVGDRLHEYRTVVVARRRGDIDLDRESGILLQHPVVDVLDALEPRHPRIVNVVRLVVENREFGDLADDFAQIGAAIVGRADGLRAERVEEVLGKVVIVERWLAHVTEIHAVDIGQEQIADLALDPHIVLDVQRHLEVVAPVLPTVSVVGQDRIVEENAQSLEIVPQPIEHDDVRRNQKHVARKIGGGLVELVEIAPGNQQREHLGLAGAGGHLEYEARPVLVEHAGRDCAGGVESEQVELVAHPSDVVKPDHRFDGLALREVIAERCQRAVAGFHQVFSVKPPVQQCD